MWLDSSVPVDGDQLVGELMSEIWIGLGIRLAFEGYADRWDSEHRVGRYEQEPAGAPAPDAAVAAG
jgi:hypothetical protein